MKPLTEPLDILVVAPHPDDAELSVGGTILRSRREGKRVGVLELSTGEPTPRGTLEIRARETEAATKALDLNWRGNLGLPNRSLEATIDARRALAEVFRLTRPRVICAPYWEDVHPDHVAASKLCDDARFWAKLTRSDIGGEPWWPPRIYYYWSIHLRIHPKPAFVFDISDVIEEKLAAIACYQSQFDVTRKPGGPPTPLEDIRARARYWGWSIGTEYAEPFGSREEIGIRSLSSLSGT